ncbi:putative monovalent cation/H+ antiporter subunit A [Ectothiorhodospira variabilis]|uniref:putative monovalent cation/H+ antiporter subunit A n=1 Tax=Ectothiorhodospira variabilis TaxID=505694 RepID=UPI001EFAC8B4|nr:putative monovalent cation/H+ antiporter subunit A [Ectothiorhodospira variabilis]MCG5493310.1 putative monovalent cation/H+ antiporter subunit A [Ectothiorhodospira variabilis]MCG5502639.1 putative monovalent cation/H+ antiporter subunit A [Ectothiorhodospira variabilis]MCG5505595.1 putative monovalent cation/H+ antiporter subunit A [Ectothiorhodospira variabilis]
MLLAILSGFLLATVAPAVHRQTGMNSGWVLAILPAALFLYFLSFLPAVGSGESIVISYPWVPGLDIQLSFLVDGLSLLFALLISGIGFFIVAYAGRYLEGHKDLGRFYVLILSFMASMLGLVLSDNLISLFVFWELTSITSYLLIGFNHEDATARRSALQGLFVTVGGGLALLTGLVMMAVVTGSYELSEILSSGDALRDHGWYVAIVLLVLLGCFTKSAQVPFHFWLPRAMAAPTPVSAYLHSATMVKAGVYLMARLNPSLGATDLWLILLGVFGALTMFTGVFMSIRSTGVKQVLAYSTVMALGTLTMLIGVGTDTAIMAAMAFLLAHSLYKGALFLIAGILDHEAGCKDFLQTGGLRHALPITATFAAIAALSLGGVIPMFGFVAKELLFEAVLEAPSLSGLLSLLTVASAILVVAVAAVVGIKPYWGPRVETPKTPHHEAPPAMLAGPAVLASLGLLFGVGVAMVDRGLLSAAAGAVYGSPVETYLSLWHGFNLPLMLSLLSLVLGLTIYFNWDRFRTATGFMDDLKRFGPERAYDKSMDGLVSISEWQTRVLQNGYLRYYLLTILLSTVALVTFSIARAGGLEIQMSLAGVRIQELVIVAVLLLAALVSVTTSSRLGAVASLGAVGFSVALIYVLFSAADVGITQVLVETLTVIMLVLVLFRLPGFLGLTPQALRIRDAVVALAFGVMVALLSLAASSTRFADSISEYFIRESEPSGFGRNIVNVILVDFRALDTLGEIVVLALAAVGVYAMIKLRAEDNRK